MGGSLGRGLGDHRGQQREALAAEGTGRGNPLPTNLSREPQKLEPWPAAETCCLQGRGWGNKYYPSLLLSSWASQGLNPKGSLQAGAPGGP